MIPEGSHNLEYDWNIFKLVEKSHEFKKDVCCERNDIDLFPYNLFIDWR